MWSMPGSRTARRSAVGCRHRPARGGALAASTRCAGQDGDEPSTAGAETADRLDHGGHQPGRRRRSSTRSRRPSRSETGADLDVQFVQWAAAHDRFTTAIAGGTTPDVAEIGTTWTPEFADAGALVDLTDAGRQRQAWATTSSPAWSRRAPSTASSTACPGTPASARSSTAPTSSRRPGSSRPPPGTSSSPSRQDQGGRARHDPVPGRRATTSSASTRGSGAPAARSPRRTATPGPRPSTRRESAGGHPVLHRPRARRTASRPRPRPPGRRPTCCDAFTKGDVAMMIAGSWTPKALLEAQPRPRGQDRRLPDPRQGRRPRARRSSAARTCRSSTPAEDPDLAWELVELMTTGEFAAKWGEETGFFPGTSRCSTRCSPRTTRWSRRSPSRSSTAASRAGHPDVRRRSRARRRSSAMLQSILSGKASVERGQRARRPQEMDEIFARG